MCSLLIKVCEIRIFYEKAKVRLLGTAKFTEANLAVGYNVKNGLILITSFMKKKEIIVWTWEKVK